MYGECQSCENKTVLFDLTHKNKDVVVFWNAWVTKNHEYMKENDSQENDKKTTKRTVKDVIQGTLAALIESFTDQLIKFKKHYFNIYHAYQMYKKCKETLSDTECIIHCDFSENYLAKLREEVQATHFGASKQQFTLQTGVIYTKNEQGLQEKSFCTISPNNSHGPIAIWAHLTPVLEYIKRTSRNVTTLHFFSDGPTTQYRQKGNFYLMTEMIKNWVLRIQLGHFLNPLTAKGLLME
ncbi:hypothetical protein PYW08_006277 [Mythimna loreyi]|uniref:Uncharacterized protein n=1 Tax=Mythimna loreyi TaxID=667449 RepID=A0ACC2QN70_9NEOP|nr:hypothetical protein PYW08_006277 [Mythimna loreyi]